MHQGNRCDKFSEQLLVYGQRDVWVQLTILVTAVKCDAKCGLHAMLVQAPLAAAVEIDSFYWWSH